MEPEDNLDSNSFRNAMYTYGNTRSTRFPGKILSPCQEIYAFNSGDLVKLRTGTAAIKITDIRANPYRYPDIRGIYVNCKKIVEWKSSQYFEPYIEENKIERFEMKNKLFATRSEPVRYGKGVTEIETGKYLLEMSDTKNYEAFDMSAIKLVVPYSYSVIFNGMNGKEYQYRGKEGTVAVNDLLMDAKDFTIARVVAINTESEAATKEFNGVKLLTAPIV